MLALNKIYGLDFGSNSVKIMQLTKDCKIDKFWIKEYARQPDGNVSNEAIISALNDIVNSNSLNNKKFVLSIPRHNCIIRKLKFPFNDLKKIDKTINFEIEPHIPYPISDVNLDYFLSYSTETECEVTVIAVNKSIINNYIKIADACKIKISAVTSADIADFNFISTQLQNKEGVIVFINFGAKNTSLIILKNGQLDFSRSIPKSGDFLSELIATHNNISFADAEKRKITVKDNSDDINIIQNGLNDIINEIHYTINSYLADSHIAKIDKMYICGGTANIKNIDNKLSKYLELNTEIINIDATVDSTLCMFNTAYGCAVQQIQLKDKIVKINLLTREEYVLFQDKKQIYISAVLLIFILSILSLNFYLKFDMQNKKVEYIDNEINKIFKETFPESKIVINSKQQLMSSINEEKKKFEINSGLSMDKLSTLKIFRELNVVIEKNINIELTDLNISEKTVILSGITKSFREVDLIKDRLKKSRVFNNTKVDSLKTRNDNKIEFRLIIQL